MLYIIRMMKLAFWHTAIAKKSPNSVRQRVKLRPVGLTPTPNNPVMGSPLDCRGTVYKIFYNKKSRSHYACVKWDNHHENTYPREYLVVADFPLKFLPRFATINKNNPNSTFKELEAYKLMEVELLEHERRMRQREEELEGIEIVDVHDINSIDMRTIAIARREF